MNNTETEKMQESVNLHDYRKAFLYKDQRALRFTYYVFLALQKPRLVKVLTGFTTFALKLHLPVNNIIRKTIYRIFCAGETADEAMATIRNLERYHVSAVLDYVSEAETSNLAFDQNKNVIVSNIRRLGFERPGNSISVKLSSLEDPEFLEQISGRTPGSLSEREFSRYRNYEARVNEICETCAQNNVIVYFDAEDRNMQDGFDSLVCSMMARFNREKAIVYNTLQMYLKDRPEYLRSLLLHAVKHGYFAGIKLVRGAYVEKERALATKKGIPSPIQDSKEETDAAFDQAVNLCLSMSDRVYTCIASHNERSTQLALELIAKLGINDHHEKVKFSQLYGMSDNLTFNLAAGGFSASKYVPYGEVKKAVPYLIRRAEENSSIGGQMPKELVYLRAELSRRSHHQLALNP